MSHYADGRTSQCARADLALVSRGGFDAFVQGPVRHVAASAGVIPFRLLSLALQPHREPSIFPRCRSQGCALDQTWNVAHSVRMGQNWSWR